MALSPATTIGALLPVLRIAAVNSASGAKGNIHDDAQARELGYAGGFVPGVTVLGYMTRLMREAFGADWLRGVKFQGRLRRPTYAGGEVTVAGTVVEQPTPENGGRVRIELRVLRGDARPDRRRGAARRRLRWSAAGARAGGRRLARCLAEPRQGRPVRATGSAHGRCAAG